MWHFRHQRNVIVPLCEQPGAEKASAVDVMLDGEGEKGERDDAGDRTKKAWMRMMRDYHRK